MSDIEEKTIARTLNSLKTLAGGSILIVISLAFAAGTWATSMKRDIEYIKERQDDMAEATKARLVDWTAWRKTLDEGTASSITKKFTSDDYDVAASIYNMRPAPALMPYFYEVRKARP